MKQLKFRKLTKEQRIRRGKKLLVKLILEERAKRKKTLEKNTPPSLKNDGTQNP